MDLEWGGKQEAKAEGIFYKVVGYENAEVARRTVVVLMAFENRTLVKGLCDRIAQVGLDDKAAMCYGASGKRWIMVDVDYGGRGLWWTWSREPT